MPGLRSGAHLQFHKNIMDVGFYSWEFDMKSLSDLTVAQILADQLEDMVFHTGQRLQ